MLNHQRPENQCNAVDSKKYIEVRPSTSSGKKVRCGKKVKPKAEPQV